MHSLRIHKAEGIGFADVAVGTCDLRLDRAGVRNARYRARTQLVRSDASSSGARAEPAGTDARIRDEYAE
jgi:hypothetical protein